jgi:two-component system, OmpR family, sensor histidine kinase BaeS
MRRRWARRAGCFAILALLLLVLLTGTLIWALGTVLGGGAGTVLLVVGWALVLALLARVVVSRLRGALAPMGDLVEASERIQAGEVGTQVEVRGPREVRSMAQAFNAMSARLAEDAERRRRLLADVSHELRTPLTVIGGSIEGMLDGLYPADRPQLERLLAETRQMERLVEDLRTLALADAGALPLHREAVDLGRLAEDVVGGFRPQAAEAGVELRTAIGDVVLEASLDPVRVRQVVANLVANALRHTPSGGTVTVAVRADGDGLALEVADTGRGMDPESAARAFDRFWRAGDASGAGLGLSIVRDLVTAHGGAATLESAEGRGTVVVCRFPRSVRSLPDALPSDA